MVFFKIAGALMLAGSGIGGAYWLNRSASVTLGQVECWLTLLRYVRMQVDCFALPVSEILGRCDAALLRGCGYTADEPPEDFGQMLARCSIRDGESAALLRSFSEEFGKSYREEQSRGCEYYFSLLNGRRETLAARMPTQRRIRSALCISGALALVILLI